MSGKKNEINIGINRALISSDNEKLIYDMDNIEIKNNKIITQRG